MPAPQSSFIIKKYEGFGGNFVDSQYLGRAYDSSKPHVFENTLMKVFSSQSRFFTGKFLLGSTGAKSYGTKEIDSEVYRWYLQGAEYQCARSGGLVDSSLTLVGYGNTTFQWRMDLDYYAEPDVVSPEDNRFHIELIGTPIPDGEWHVYTGRLQGDDPSAYIPAYLFDNGQEFSKMWTTVQSEFNEIGGTQQVPSSFQLESQVSFFEQHFTVTDKAWRDSGRLGVEVIYTDPRTQKESITRSFLPMYEAQMHNELYMGMEAQMTYGVKQTQPGHKDYWKKTGPGLRPQLADSWIEYYTTLTTDLKKEYLLDIFFSRVDEQDRKVAAMTGTLGSILFHDMLAADASSFFTMDTHFITKAQGGAANHLAFGAQFTQYRGPEGIEVTLVKNPLYDSRQYCRRMHPQYKEFPIDSARFTYLDFGSSNGENNIQMIKVKDTYKWGFVAGSHTPTGPVMGGQAGSTIAGYTMFTGGSCGLWIKDVTRCGEMITEYDF